MNIVLQTETDANPGAVLDCPVEALALRISKVLCRLGWYAGAIAPRSSISGRIDTCGLFLVALIISILLSHLGILRKKTLVRIAITL